MQNFAKLYMALCSYADAGKLKVPELKEKLSSKEVYEAESYVELPSVTEWLHFFMHISCS